MWLFLKNSEEIESIILNNKNNKKYLIKVSQEKDRPLWYSEEPNKEDYNKYIDYVKDSVLFLRMHNSWAWNYFWKLESKKEIINNYWEYSFKKRGHKWYIVEWELKLNRHLKLADIFKHDHIINIVHNSPPSLFKYIFILYIVNKYNLDSYEIWGIRKLEKIIWKYTHKIDAMEDWDYLIFKNSNNFKISNIIKNQK